MAGVLPLEGVDEALGHAVDLRGAKRRIHRCEAHEADYASGFMSDMGTDVYRQKLPHVPCWHVLCNTKILLTASMSISRTGSPGKQYPVIQETSSPRTG